jgi:hypothetical protein
MDLQGNFKNRGKNGTVFKAIFVSYYIIEVASGKNATPIAQHPILPSKGKGKS